MNFRVNNLIFIYLWIIADALADNTTRSSEEENSEIFHESTEGSLFQDHVFPTETTFLIEKETHQNLATAVVLKPDEANNTNDFKPSVHLGEIEEPRINNNPFNKIQHLKFENNLDVRSHQAQSHVKFDDDTNAYRNTNYRTVFPNQEITQPSQTTVTQSSRLNLDNFGEQKVINDQSLLQNFGEQKVINDQSLLQNLYKPLYVEEHTSMIFEKPMRFPNEFQEHLQLGSANLGEQNTLYSVSDYHLPNEQNNYHVEPPEATYTNVQKPENAMVYLSQQQEYTRMRKQPHYYYHQPVGYHEMGFLGEARPTVLYPKEQDRISPWRRIVHLIGAFLPLGLLLASLAPNVIKIENTTQPNIVLSKLRVVDLPIEHKQARFVDEPKSEVCEERSLCELILGGGKPRSNIVQNVLWNIAIRSNEETAKKSGLQEIFDAVKKKNCGAITC